jgi:hypothetical protein
VRGLKMKECSFRSPHPTLLPEGRVIPALPE